MSLSEFHAAVATEAEPRMNWADEMEALDEDSPQQSQFHFDRSKLPTAPKSVRQSEIDLELIPKKAPFKAFLGNISFEADEEKIRAFFRDLKIVSVHLTVDQGGRSKGSGTVEFEDRDSLIAALNKNEGVINNRPLRISLMEARDRDGGGRMGGYGNRDDGGELKSDASDWRRREPEPEPENVYPYGRSANDRGGDRGGDRGDRRGYGGYQRRDGGDRSDRGGYGGERRGYGGDRGGYGGDRGGYGGDRTDRGGYGGERRGYGGRQDGEGYERRQYGGYNRGDQNENRSEGENAWSRSAPAPEQERQERQERPAPVPTSAPMTERPKLQLQPRTLPVEEVAATQTSSSIFGSAKPVNTAAREREIEEKLKHEVPEEETKRTQTISTTSDDSQSNNQSQNSVTSPQSVSRQTENPWKSRQAADLFAGQERGADASRGNTYNGQANRYDDRRGGYNKRPDSHQSQGGNRGYNRDGRGGGDRRGGGRQNEYRGGGRNYSDKPERVYKNYNDPKPSANDEPQDIGFVNKFAGLEVDVDEV